MKNRIIAVLCVIITAVTLSACQELFSAYYHYNDRPWEREYFGEETYAELLTPCSDEDREELESIVRDFDKAMSSIYDNWDESEAEWGEYLACYTQYYNNTVRAEHDVKFLTGKVEDDNAYLWIEYWSAGYDSLGKVSRGDGSKDEPCKVRITAEKIDGEWVIIGLNEHP